MEHQNILFWNVDTQVDFVEPGGKLYVEGAEKRKDIWRQLTQLAHENAIKVVNTCDYHHPNSLELSDNPNFIDLFPPHCLQGTKGFEFIDETNPENPGILDWDKEYTDDKLKKLLVQHRNLIIRKDAFDVFAGNPNTDRLVWAICPELVVVYGVTTNVCVDFAVTGLAKRVKKVMVVSDAIKELTTLPLPYVKWHNAGIEMIEFKELSKQML